MKCSNQQHALHWIYQKNIATRSTLVDELGISQASTMRLVTTLLENSYLVEKTAANMPVGRGRPSNVFGINPDCGVVAGIEFGREHLIIYFAAADGTEIGWCEVVDVPLFDPSPATLDHLIQIVLAEAEKCNISPESIQAVGLSVHDLVTADGKWITWDHPLENPFAAREYIAEKYGYFTYVDDVSRAFAFAEHCAGAGQGMTDMIYLFVGRQGIGAGVFVNGELLKSASGFGGEIGHIRVVDDGILCQCGNRGCLETVATYEAILTQVQAKLAAGVVSSLSQNSVLTFADVCQAYQEGDKIARIVLGQLAKYIARALVSTINIVGASTILIGGQLHLAGDHFATELVNLLHKQLIPGLAHNVSVEFAELTDHAGAWGIARQALDGAWESGHFLKIRGLNA